MRCFVGRGPPSSIAPEHRAPASARARVLRPRHRRLVAEARQRAAPLLRPRHNWSAARSGGSITQGDSDETLATRRRGTDGGRGVRHAARRCRTATHGRSRAQGGARDGDAGRPAGRDRQLRRNGHHVGCDERGHHERRLRGDPVQEPGPRCRARHAGRDHRDRRPAGRARRVREQAAHVGDRDAARERPDDPRRRGPGVGHHRQRDRDRDSGLRHRRAVQPHLHYPDKTVQNVKVLFNLTDLFTFKGSINKTAKAADLFVENLPNSETSVGHGTHVAGITAGLGTASGGYYTGVAPGAKLIGLGTGDILFIFWALAGFDYILDHQQAYNIKVVNNSWGTSGPFDPKDPINKATKKVHDKGITVIFAAGNDGPDQNTLNPYSVAPWVIGVAAGCKLVTPDPTNSAVHCADQTGQNRPAWLADFSSRGIPGSSLYHPDITAPGVHIVSTRASTGTVLNALDANHDFDLTSSCAISVANEPYYTCASGTSMATPHVVGVVALMQEAAGGRLTPDKIASVLTQTARPLPGFALWEVGAGYVDALAAVNT